MDKEKLQEFSIRVTQANRSELVVIIYEAALESILSGKKFLQQGEIEKMRKEIERAKNLLTELIGSLEMKYEVSSYLRQLYIFAYHELCQGVALRQNELFEHAEDILEKLLESFREVAKEDDSKPVMQNVQNIYAGLTYGRKSLNETIGTGVDFHRGINA